MDLDLDLDDYEMTQFFDNFDFYYDDERTQLIENDLFNDWYNYYIYKRMRLSKTTKKLADNRRYKKQLRKIKISKMNIIEQKHKQREEKKEEDKKQDKNEMNNKEMNTAKKCKEKSKSNQFYKRVAKNRRRQLYHQHASVYAV